MKIKDIEGYEGIYTISEDGRVYSFKTDQFIVGHVNKRGYTHLSFRAKGKRKTLRLHRLVAKAFIPNPYNLPQVDHIDEDKTNNHISNLRWCTNKENADWYYSNNPEKVCSSPEAKPVYINGVVYRSCGGAASYIVEEESKLNNIRNKATISKELRRFLQGKKGEWSMYGRYDVSNGK